MGKCIWFVLLVAVVAGSVLTALNTTTMTGVAAGIAGALLLGIAKVLWFPPKSNPNADYNSHVNYW